MKLEQTECSETFAYKIQKPGIYPEESIQSSKYVEMTQVFEDISGKINAHVVSLYV